MLNFDEEKLLREVSYQTSRSGGKGGQHVNKVSTKVALNFSIDDSDVLSDLQKQLVKEKLVARINALGVLKVVSEEERTQFRNKKKADEKFIKLIKSCFKIKKKRVPTTPDNKIKEERLKEKRKISEKKVLRYKNITPLS